VNGIGIDADKAKCNTSDIHICDLQFQKNTSVAPRGFFPASRSCEAGGLLWMKAETSDGRGA
jgi:hypothetical protein